MVSGVRFHESRRTASFCLIFVLLAVFADYASAQGTTTPEAYHRWASAKSIKGTFTWSRAGSTIFGNSTITVSESGSGTATLIPLKPFVDGTTLMAFQATRNTLGFPDGGNFNLPYTFSSEQRIVFPCPPEQGGPLERVVRSTGGGDDGGFVVLGVSSVANGTSSTFSLKSIGVLGTQTTRVTDTGCGINQDGSESGPDSRNVGPNSIDGSLPLLGSLSGSAKYTDVVGIEGTLAWSLTPEEGDKDKNIANDCKQGGGSTVSCENQTLGEDIGIVGAPFVLHYESDRVPGREESNDTAKALATQLNGWTVSLHHAYDPATNRLYMGNGQRRDAIALGAVNKRSDGTYFISSDNARQIYVFDGTGQHLKTRDALIGVEMYKFTYDAQQRLISVTDVNGNLTKIERNASGKPTAIVSPFNQRTLLAIDANGYLSSVTNPANEVIRLTSTATGLLTRFTNPKGISSNFSYDAKGRLLRDDNAAGGFMALSRAVKSDGSFDASLTTAQARTTKYAVTLPATGGESRSIVSPANLTTKIVRDAANGTTTIGPDGTKMAQQLSPDPRFGLSAPIVKNSFATMPSGLKLATIGNRSVSLAIPSDPFSLTSLSDTTSINGRTYASKYDAATKTFTDTSPQGRQSKVTIDAKGRVVSQQTAGLFPVQYTYDSRGRVATVTAGVGTTLRTTTFAYDASSYLNSIVDPIGRRVSFARDAVGRVKQQTLPDGRTIAFVYDQNGNLTGLTPPGRPEHKFAYDQLDQTAEYQPPAAGLPTSKTTYRYNLDRDSTGIGRPDGKNIAMAYDTAGRMSNVTLSRGALRYAYHPTTGNLSTVDSPDSVRLSYGYDGSLPISETWSGAVAGTLKRKFDNNFRVVQTQVNGETPIASGYDFDGLLIKAGDLTLTRNPQNGLLTGSKLGVVSDRWTYNGFGEPLSYRASAAASTLYDVQFNRDALGRITTKIETVAGVRTIFGYAYDLAGRLSEVKRNGIVTSKYTYDSNGNRLTHTSSAGTVSGTYDDQDRLLSYGNATYTYTANGELKTKKVGNQTTTYDYDELGNLIAVILPDGKKITYVIDGASRRVGKKVNGVLVQAFLYDGRLRPVAELDGADHVVSRFVYAARINVPDYIIKGGAVYRVETDHLGSPRLVVAAATGAIAQKIEYDEFGNISADSNTGFQPFGFAGGFYDPDTKLARFWARDYDANTGRWTTKDPIGLRGGANMFKYSAADPINLVDPTGLDPGFWSDVSKSFESLGDAVGLDGDGKIDWQLQRDYNPLMLADRQGRGSQIATYGAFGTAVVAMTVATVACARIIAGKLKISKRSARTAIDLAEAIDSLTGPPMQEVPVPPSPPVIVRPASPGSMGPPPGPPGPFTFE